MKDLATPYMWSDNLSVDNALNSRQIIHQLITKINELVTLYNNLDIEVDSKIDSKITKELTDLENELSNAIQKAFENSTDYTDLAEQRLNDKIEKVSKEGKNAILTLESELKEYTDTKVLEVNTKIMELYTEFDKLAKNSFASISPLDGSLKSNRDCFYDMLHVFQRQNSVNLDGIIAMMLYVSGSNYPYDDALIGTNIENMLAFCNESSESTTNKAISFTNQSAPLSAIMYTMSNISTVAPTWGNIVSCGLTAIASLGKTYELSDGSTAISRLGEGCVLYNVYNNKSVTDGYTVNNQFTGTEFKPFDITKM